MEIIGKIKNMLMLDMNINNIVKLINQATGNSTNTKKLLLNCKHTVLNKDKLLVKYIIEDLNNFIKWLPNKQQANKIAKNINSLNLNRITSGELTEVIERVFDVVLGEKVLNLRVHYDVSKVLNWLGEYPNSLMVEINKYFKSENGEDVYDDMVNIFLKFLGNDFSYYEDLYRKWNEKRVADDLNDLYNERFEFRDKYGVNTDIRMAALKIKKKYFKWKILKTTFLNLKLELMVSEFFLSIK